MSLISYGKCNGCGRFDMLNLFWYNMESTVPYGLCDSCMAEFDRAMEESAWQTLYGRDLYDSEE